MTLDERANKALDAMGDNCYIFCCSEAVSAYIDGFTHGATEQKKIDDKELATVKEFYHQIGYEYAIKKACEYIMTHPTYAVQPEVYAEGLRKAMEE